MSIKSRSFVVSFLIICSFLISAFYKQQPNCKFFKTGRFYFYSKDNQNNSIITRNGLIQKEYNVRTGNTSIWKITWLSDCEYTCRYVSGIKMESSEMEAFYKTAILKFSITKTDKDYYVYNALITSPLGKKESSDTMWLKIKKG